MPILFLHNEVYNLKGCHTHTLNRFCQKFHAYLCQIKQFKKKKNTDALFEL